MTEINYQELVDGYYDNLNNNLRNFKGGPGFLETWVHDEDHNRSLLEIVDLAHSHGIDNLDICLPATVKSSLNLDWLRRNASEYGSLELTEEKLKYTNTKPDQPQLDEFGGLSEHYVDSLKRQAASMRYEGPLETRNLKSFSAQEEGGTLVVAVDEKGLVKEAKHSGFQGTLRPVMDAFCGVLIDRTLQEGAEHGGIRLETGLRDHTKPAKVKGLMTLEIADTSFVVPQKLVRQLFKDFVVSEKIEPKRNFWRDPVPASWLEMPYEDRVKEAQRLVKEGSALWNLQDDVKVVKILNDTRFVLDYKQAADKPDFGRHMIKIERWLREQLKFEVELQLESIEDRNRREERTKRT